MILTATVLNIDSQHAYNAIVLLISAIGFVIMYNKNVKNRVDKSDMDNLKKYVDQQDRSLHHRVDGLENRLEKKLDLILERLLGK